jgi:urease accessory protein
MDLVALAAKFRPRTKGTADVEARARLTTAVRGERTVATELRSEAPLLLRTSPRSDHLDVHLVGGAAGPLGGDDLRLDVDVGGGSVVVVRSVAAQLAQPDPRGRSSTAVTDVHLRSGASLEWCPEPLISVAGSDHRMVTLLRIEAGATVRWTDTIVLGRTGEAPGRIAARLRVEVGGRPLLDHDLVAGLGRLIGPVPLGDRNPLAGPGANGRARTLTSTFVYGPDAPAEPSTIVATDGSRTATFPLAPAAALAVHLAP